MVLGACMGNSPHEASIGPYFHRNMRPNLCAADRQGHLVVITLNFD
jgi:hypothetical protein